MNLKPERHGRRRLHSRALLGSLVLASASLSACADDQGDDSAELQAILRDGDLSLLSGKVAVVGYGAQGHAHAGIYGLDVNGSVGVFCHANRTTLPNVGPALRVRLTTFAPRYDCGDFDENEYARLIVELFFGAVGLSNGPMECEQIEFHLRSLADKPFFAALGHIPIKGIPFFGEQ